jgi:hypothetical protein
MHADTRRYNDAQAPGERAICRLLAQELNRHLPEDRRKGRLERLKQTRVRSVKGCRCPPCESAWFR